MPGKPSKLKIDPKYFSKIKTGKELFAEIVRNLLFGENAMEDHHAETALVEGVDEYGRVFLDFDEDRRNWVIQCLIRQACKNAEERKLISEKKKG